MEIKNLLISASISLILLASIVLAADYYAKVNTYFWVPSDAAFALSFPSDYTANNVSITSNQTTSTWISFNFTSSTESGVQPQTNGVTGDKQAGITKPIFLVQNIGNVPTTIQINASVPAGFTVCANSTTVTTCTALSGTFTNMKTSLAVGAKENITLYGSTSSASGGQSSGNVFLLSFPT